MRGISTFVAGITLLIPLAAHAQDLAPGPGADVVTDNCQNCHGLDQITSQHHDANGWRTVVTDMIGRGASVTEDQEEQIVAYLASHYGNAGANGTSPSPAK